MNAKWAIARCFPSIDAWLTPVPVPPGSGFFRRVPPASGQEMAPEWRWLAEPVLTLLVPRELLDPLVRDPKHLGGIAHRQASPPGQLARRHPRHVLCLLLQPLCP